MRRIVVANCRILKQQQLSRRCCSRPRRQSIQAWSGPRQCQLLSSSTSSERHSKVDSSFDDSKTSSSTTHFGFENVPTNEKEGRVRRVFENVADSYDVMNDVMSGGLHRYWKDVLVQETKIGPMARAIRRRQKEKLSVLDVAGGTGDVAFRMVEAADCMERSKSSGNDPVCVTVCDINPEMLRVGRQRAQERYRSGGLLESGSHALEFQEGNAQELPFSENSFDLYTIAFGLRNVTNIDLALREAYRVLKPGGRYFCLEFSHVPSALFRNVYDAYSFHVIPTMGDMIANDRASYQYLVESIRQFPNQDELVAKLQNAGFQNCSYTNMTLGIVAVHQGWKPL